MLSRRGGMASLYYLLIKKFEFRRDEIFVEEQGLMKEHLQRSGL